MAKMGCSPGVVVTVQQVSEAGEVVRERRFEVKAFDEVDADDLYGSAEAQTAALAMEAEAMEALLAEGASGNYTTPTDSPVTGHCAGSEPFA